MAQRGNQVFEESDAGSVRAGLVTALPGAVDTIAALRAAAIKVCLCTGFAPAARDAVLRSSSGWRPAPGQQRARH